MLKEETNPKYDPAVKVLSSIDSIDSIDSIHRIDSIDQTARQSFDVCVEHTGGLKLYSPSTSF